MRFNGLTKGFFIFILALVTWAFFDVLSPYFSAILWAAILTVIFNPVKNRLRAALGDRNGLASLLTIGIICLIYDECFGNGRIDALRAVTGDTTALRDEAAPDCPEYQE